MNKNDIRLEQIAAQAEEFEVPQSIPVFEIFSSITAIALAILLFLVPGFLAHDPSLFHLMESVMGQPGWAVALMVGGVIGAVGNLVNSISMRITSLFILAAVYGSISACYIVEYPNLGSVVMPGMAVFCMITVPIVKFTALGKKKHKRKWGIRNGKHETR